MLNDILYESKKFYRNKEGAFFGLLFPIVFGLIYILAFSNLITQNQSLDPIPVAVTIENHSEEIKGMMDRVGRKGKIQNGEVVVSEKSDQSSNIINYVLLEADEAENQLKTKSVKHVLTLGKKNQQFYGRVTTLPSEMRSIETNLLYNVLDSLLGIQDIITMTIEEHKMNPIVLMQLPSIFETMDSFESYTEEDHAEGTSGFSVFFYACLGYICLYFMSSGIYIVINNEANYHHQAIRLQNAPLPKKYRLLIRFIPVFLTSLILTYFVMGMFIVANIPLGTQIGHIILLLTEGVLVGVLSGICIATYIKVSAAKLNGLVTTLSLVLGAMAGLMAPPLTELIRETAPWLNRINPIGLVSEGIYFLNNYPTNQQYWMNVCLLAVWILILGILTWRGTKEESYETL